MKQSRFVAGLAMMVAVGALGMPAPAMAQDGECSFAGFNQKITEFTTENPVQSSWGTRDTYQYAYFMGVEGLKILQEFRSCMSDQDFAANYQALSNMRDNGRENCPKFATDPSSCQPVYPGN